MKRSLTRLLALLIVLSGIWVSAETRSFSVSRDQGGQQLQPTSVGGRWYRMTDISETLVASGPLVLLGVHLYNTGAAVQNTFFQVRDSASAGNNATNTVVRFGYEFETGSGKNRLSAPIFINTGLVIDISSTGNTEQATVVYLELD